MTTLDGTVHQAFFGWSAGRRRHTMLAHSFDGEPEAAYQWEARLRHHVRLVSVGGGQAPASALSYLVFEGEQAAVVRRVGHGKSHGRENAHALVGPAAVLTPSTALGLGVMPEKGLWLTESAEGARMTPFAAEYFTRVPDPSMALRPIAQGLGARLVKAVAALLEHPMTPLSVLGCPDDDRLAAVWALREALAGVVQGNWSFSTFAERQDSLHGLVRLLFLSTNQTLSAVNRTVVDFDRPSSAGPHTARAEQLVAAVLGGQRTNLAVIADSGAHAAAESRGGHAAVESPGTGAAERYGSGDAESRGKSAAERYGPGGSEPPGEYGPEQSGHAVAEPPLSGYAAADQSGHAMTGARFGHGPDQFGYAVPESAGGYGAEERDPARTSTPVGTGTRAPGAHATGQQRTGHQGAEAWRSAPSYDNGRATPDPKADLSKPLRAAGNVEDWLAEVALLRHDHTTARVRKDFDLRTVDKVTDFVESTTPKELVGRFLETLYGHGCKDLRDPAAKPHALALIAGCRSDRVAAELGMRARDLDQQDIVDAAFNRWLRDGRLRGPVASGRIRGVRPVVGNNRRLAIVAAVAVMSLVLIGFLLGYIAFAPATAQPSSTTTAVPSATTVPPVEPPPVEPPPVEPPPATTVPTTDGPTSGVPRSEASRSPVLIQPSGVGTANPLPDPSTGAVGPAEGQALRGGGGGAVG